MPMIRGRYYANPAYGQAMERARERDAEMEMATEGDEEGGGAMSGAAHNGSVHHIHIQRHADGVRVHVHHHGPASDDDAPSGHWATHNFDHGDHEAVGRFVSSVLARGHARPDGRSPFPRS